MKAILLATTIICSTIAYAQPGSNDIKKHKIKKTIERRTDDSGTKEHFWYFDRNGNDSIKSEWGRTTIVKNTYQNGKLVEKVLQDANAGKTAPNHVYVYEYQADGSYKVTYTDAEFGMKSYEWHDKKDNIVKSQSPDGNTTTFKYDAKGKLMTVKSDGYNSGTKIDRKYYYNAKGQMIKVEDSMDGVTSISTYIYDARNRLLTVIEKGGWRGEDAVVESKYQYNGKGLKSKIVMKVKSEEEESTTTYEYLYEYY